jgi:hypothetical protein
MSTAPSDDDDLGPGLALRVAVECVIREAVEEDPDRVIRALADVVDRCKTEGRYSVEEIEAAAAQLRRELGIRPRTN